MHKKNILMLSVCLFFTVTQAVAGARQTPGGNVPERPGGPAQVVAGLQQRAASSDLAWQLLSDLTSEVGPRLAGSEADARAVKWAVARLKAMGFDRVWTEPVTFPRWVRRHESAAVVAPHPQQLAVTALGGTPGTNGPLEGRIAQFDSLAALEAASPEQVAGKIVFISQRMRRTRDGAGYPETVVIRTRGPFVAAAKGAKALLIRSVGTDNNRLPHTGNISRTEAGRPVPAAALSSPDADDLLLMLGRKEPVVVRLDLDVGLDGEATSYNVIGEFDGRAKDGRFVLLGAHLDSWDPGTGAVDDGAGVAIVTAAAKLVADLPARPRHGIRVVLYADEEGGAYGGRAYAQRHAKELGRHLLGAESDLGADRIYAFNPGVLPGAEPVMDELAKALSGLGIERETGKPPFGGSDVGQMGKRGMALVDLKQDASRYFDLHHSANDTLDKVDPGNLRQNLAAWVTLVYLAANSDVAFGPLPAAP